MKFFCWILVENQFSAATCSDGFQNQDETDVDCGGLICTARCALLKYCGRNSDCTNGFCRGTDKTCQSNWKRKSKWSFFLFFVASSCSDGFRNQDETDIDCGGSTCGVKCSNTKTCGKDADCTSGFCPPTDKTCQSKGNSFLQFSSKINFQRQHVLIHYEIKMKVMWIVVDQFVRHNVRIICLVEEMLIV